MLAEPHMDSHNDPDSDNMVLALSEFGRGGLWVEDPQGSAERTVNGGTVKGPRDPSLQC